MKNILFATLVLFATVSIHAQTLNATLLELNGSNNSNPKGLIKAGSKLYFIADDGVHGDELWTHDFLLNVTTMVKDINPGATGLGFSSELVAIGNIIYFNANDGVNGSELWRSDGTDAGTYMVKDQNPVGSANPYSLTNCNGKLIFGCTDSELNYEIYVSDGTAAGTHLLKDIYTGSYSSYPIDLFYFNNFVYFNARDLEHGSELWKTDGTSEGTVLVKDINQNGTGLDIGNKFIPLGDSIFFFANSLDAGYELWKSDGTEAGTVMVKDINPGIASSSQIIIGAATENYIVFAAVTDGSGRNLWKSDGTAAGTILLKQLSVYDVTAQNEEFVTFNNNAYFTGNYNGQMALWKTDGTPDGTQVLNDGTEMYVPKALTSTDNFVIFQASEKVWKTDGTLTGTVAVHDVPVSNIYSDLHFVSVGENIYFPAGYRTETGTELYKTDGTAANTKIVIDINHALGSGTRNPSGYRFPAVFGDKMFFIAENYLTGKEPYVTDGTPEGTHLIKNINGNFGASIETNPNESSRPMPHPTAIGGKVFFAAADHSGFEPFVTDGTSENSQMIKDIFPGDFNSINSASFFAAHNGIFYFKSDDNEHGNELWRTDGTESGTYMLKDIFQGYGSGIESFNRITNGDDDANPKAYAVFNGFLHFTANNGDSTSIWRTDGTGQGTVEAVNIPNIGSFGVGTNPVIMGVANSRLFFTNKSDSASGNNTLWSTDGTQSGTIQLDYVTGTGQFDKTAVANGVFYYTVSNSGNPVLKKSDGTIAGTVTVKENFTNYDVFTALKPCGNYLYFGVGNLSEPAKELWRTDATTNGTVAIDHISENEPEFIYSCTCVLNQLFYYRQLFAKQIYAVSNISPVPVAIDVNVVNGAQLTGISEGISTLSGLSAFGDKLLFQATTARSGSELYVASAETLLATAYSQVDFSQQTILYPNPSTGKITVETTGHEIINSVKVYSLLGEQLYHQEFADSKNATLNIGQLNRGIYLIIIKMDSGVETKKLILN